MTNIYFVWTGSNEEFVVSKYTFREFNYQLERWIERIWRKMPLIAVDEQKCMYGNDDARIEVSSVNDIVTVAMSWSRTQHPLACMFLLWLHHECGARLPQWFNELQYRDENQPFLFAYSPNGNRQDELLSKKLNQRMRKRICWADDDIGKLVYIVELLDRIGNQSARRMIDSRTGGGRYDPADYDDTNEIRTSQPLRDNGTQDDVEF